MLHAAPALVAGIEFAVPALLLLQPRHGNPPSPPLLSNPSSPPRPPLLPLSLHAPVPPPSGCCSPSSSTRPPDD